MIKNLTEIEKEIKETLDSFNSWDSDDSEQFRKDCSEWIVDFISQFYSSQSIKKFFYNFGCYLELKYRMIQREQTDYLNSLNTKYGNLELRDLNCTDEENNKMINYMTQIENVNYFYSCIAAILGKLVEGAK